MKRRTSICEICKREISLSNIEKHSIACLKKSQKPKGQKPKGNPNWLQKGKTPWNKGLTKETSESLMISAKNLSIATKGKPRPNLTEETKKKISDKRKKFLQDNPEKHPNRLLASNKSKMTYPERIVAEWLENRKIDFEHNLKVGAYYPDFVIGNLIIEVDGEYWHDKVQDEKRDEDLKKMGYEVVRIPTKDFIIGRLENIFGEWVNG